jgi:REP element-mobilizing transposase RayT
MTTPRKQQVCLEATPYYHCVSRCVRRTFLCGYDEQNKRDYEHRKSWVEQRILLLAEAYCINICAYAVMSNHYHIVLHIDKEASESLTVNEVVERWVKLHKLPVLIQRFVKGETSSKPELDAAHAIIESWRERLYSLSWFMKELNHEIALKANREDQCKGHFWESRYKCQALLDEKALLSAMAYTDLNPVRANISPTPEQSNHTSIKLRLDSIAKRQATPTNLSPFIGTPSNEMIQGIPFRLMDYIELVDWSARQFSERKASICENLPPVLERLSFSQSEWLKVVTQLESKRVFYVGSKQTLKNSKPILKRKRIHAYQIV